MSQHRFRTIEEALEYFHSDHIEEELAALPLDVDELTDEEQVDDQNLEAPLIQDIARLIHFQDNSKANEHKHDKSFKTKLLEYDINKKFHQWGIFEKYLSIDEMIVSYYGSNSIKQFIRSKTIRFGYKL
ncbi:hypothetical protein PR048_013428 [Dryococelus australis]|uniref:PiggyBac transposable element-derived protein domain-containing protein n=1 Tax=Dryococelus australis TaxID=614101 RepID=A0ABQ9HTM7_9NEOP|nr:hypothetical protein PR048_013428 [Dryococelus australis]